MVEIQLKIKVEEKVSSIKALKNDLELPFKQSGDHIELTLPKLELFETLVVGYA